MAEDRDEKPENDSDALDTANDAAPQTGVDLDDDVDTKPVANDEGDDAPAETTDDAPAEQAPEPKAETASKPSVLDRMARLMGLDNPEEMPASATPAVRETPAAKSDGPVTLTKAQEATLKDLAEAMGDDNDPVVVSARKRFEEEQREREPVMQRHQQAEQDAAKQTYSTVAKFFKAKAEEGYGDKYDLLDLAESVRTGKAHPVVAMAAKAREMLRAAGEECSVEDALEAAHSLYTRKSHKATSDAKRVTQAGNLAKGTGLPPTRRTGVSKGGDPWAKVKANLEAVGVRN